MSVRILTNAEADLLAGAALAVGLISDVDEATELGRCLLRQHVEAYAWTYPMTDKTTLVRMRGSVEAYTFNPPADLEHVYEVMGAYDYNAAAAPSWVDSPVRARFETLKERWRKRSSAG